MNTLSTDFKKDSLVDEKQLAEISNGVAVTVAEDTLEAAHQCTPGIHPLLPVEQLLTLVLW